MKEHKLLFIAIYAISSLICTSCNNETLVDQETANKKYECYYKSMGENLPNGKEAATIYINNLTNSMEHEYTVVSFGNKLRTPNINFDLKDIFIYPKADSALIYKDKDANRIFGHLTDNIQPIRFNVVENIDGDFVHSDKVYFTGGFHGYANNTDNGTLPTLYEKKKEVYVDGKQIEQNTKAVGSKITIKVTNLLQASNTERSDGHGRYALEQRITITYKNDTAFVQVDYTPLEDIIIYQVDGLGFFNDLNFVKFIGSRTKAGIYSNKIVNRADKNVKAIRQFNDLYDFDVFIDPKYGIGNLQYNKSDYNAQTTDVQKSYFHLIDNQNSPAVKFSKGERFSLRGGYTFKKK